MFRLDIAFITRHQLVNIDSSVRILTCDENFNLHVVTIMQDGLTTSDQDFYVHGTG